MSEIENHLEEDFLEVDTPIPGQNYVCMSFISPEEVLKNKNVFFVNKFLETIAKNYDLDKDSIQEKYKDFLYVNNEKLEKEFYQDNEFKTTMRGVKIRGSYDTLKEAQVRAKLLQKKDKNFNVFVGQVGYWLPWDPSTEDIKDQEYQEDQLNQLMKKYNENVDEKEEYYEQEKQEKIKKARQENRKKNKTDKSEFELNKTEDKDNIEKMRTIVDNSRGYSTKKEDIEKVTNEFKKLTDDDPWLKRQKNIKPDNEKKVMTIEEDTSVSR